jgi:hypothetical protein
MIEQRVDQEKIERLANELQRLAQDELLIERGILDLKNQLTETCVLLNQQIGGTAVVSVTGRSALEVVIEFRGRELLRCEFLIGAVPTVASSPVLARCHIWDVNRHAEITSSTEADAILHLVRLNGQGDWRMIRPNASDVFTLDFVLDLMEDYVRRGTNPKTP